MVRQIWRRLRRGARQMAEAPSEEELRRFHIAAKWMHYACETAALAVGAGAARLAGMVGELQDVLGAYQDAMVLRAWLRQVAREYPETGLVASELAGIEAARIHVTITGRREAWRKVDRKRLCRWLRG